MPDTREKYQAMKRLNFMVMKLNSMRKAPVALEAGQRYEEALARRFGRKTQEKKRGQGRVHREEVADGRRVPA
jgi:hypothetical protein